MHFEKINPHEGGGSLIIVSYPSQAHAPHFMSAS